MSDRKEGMLARLIIALCLLTALLPAAEAQEIAKIVTAQPTPSSAST